MQAHSPSRIEPPGDTTGMNTTPTIGHNQPPPSASLTNDARAWSEWMASVYREHEDRLKDLEKHTDDFFTKYPAINSEIQAAVAADIRAELTALRGLTVAEHTKQKAPILAATRAIDGYQSAFATRIDEKIKMIRDAANAFLIAEDAKRVAEERRVAELARQAAQKAADEAAATMNAAALMSASRQAAQAERLTTEAEQPAGKRTRVVGDMGGAMSLRTTWKFDAEQSDLMTLVKAVAAGQADIRFLAFNGVVIGQAVRSEKLRSLPGCKIYEHRST